MQRGRNLQKQEKLNNEEFHRVSGSTIMYVSRTIKLILRRTGHVTDNCEKRNTYKTLIGKAEGIKSLADRIITK